MSLFLVFIGVWLVLSWLFDREGDDYWSSVRAGVAGMFWTVVLFVWVAS